MSPPRRVYFSGGPNAGGWGTRHEGTEKLVVSSGTGPGDQKPLGEYRKDVTMHNLDFEIWEWHPHDA